MPLVGSTGSTVSISHIPPSQPNYPPECNCKIEYIKEKQQYQATIQKFTKINNDLRKKLKKYQNHANFLEKTKNSLEQTIREFIKPNHANDANGCTKVKGKSDEVSRLMKVGFLTLNKLIDEFVLKIKN